MILQKYPEFNDPLSFIKKTSKDKNEILRKMDAYGMKMFDEDNVILSDGDTIEPKDLLSRHGFPRFPQSENWADKVITALDKKIHGKWGENHKYDFEKLAKEGGLPALKEKFPFADEEMMNLSKEHGYRTSGALSHSIGRLVMPKVMEALYRQLKHFDNEKFKVIFKDNQISFIANYENLIQHYKANNSLKELEKEYRAWKASININWQEFINQIEIIERNIDKDAFRNAISSYEGHSRARDYETRR